MEKQSGEKLKKLRSDNGGEYKSENFQNYCKSEGILQEFTAAYSPNQNGVAERMNRTILEKARSMLSSSKLGLEFWGEAVMTAAYVANRSPHSSVNDMTPEEAWSGSKPSVKHLRVFGCKASVLILPQSDRKSKLSSKVCWGIFVGYGGSSMGYRIWNPVNRSIMVRRDVRFYEDQIYFNGGHFSEEMCNESEGIDLTVGLQPSKTMLPSETVEAVTSEEENAPKTQSEAPRRS